MKSHVGETRFRRLIFRCVRSFAMLSILCGASAILAAPSAMALGCQAHEIIALIAEKHLSPHASAMVQQILRDIPIDPAVNDIASLPTLARWHFLQPGQMTIGACIARPLHGTRSIFRSASARGIYGFFCPPGGLRLSWWCLRIKSSSCVRPRPNLGREPMHCVS